MNNQKAKILVEIAAYKEPELLNTVNSAIIQADNPDRVFFAICYQSDNLDDYNELKKIKNCKIKYLKESEAKGSCYARYLCQKMLEDEEYIFQVDSHMRFVKHWDTKMIEELLSLNDKKASISFYPPNCTVDMMPLPLDDKIYDKPTSGGIMYTNGFKEDSSLFINNNVIPIDENNKRTPSKNPLISAGNFFSFSQIHRDILHDPEMYFYGDELPMAIRYYTHGWNNYDINKCYVYHQYERKNTSFPEVNNAVENELLRFKRLLNFDNENYDLGEFGLGKERTIKQFEEYAGIDFNKRLIYMDAEAGNFTKDKMDKKVSFLKKERSKYLLNLEKSENIEVLIIDISNDLEECVKSFKSTASNNNNISFIIGTRRKTRIEEDFIKENNIKEIVYFKDNATYSIILSILIPKLGDSYVLLSDSVVRAIPEWDKYLCESIKKCGTKSALTSWVWKINDDTDINSVVPYNNIVKVFDSFYYFVPIYKYDESIKLENRKKPYSNPLISDGFLFCKSKILKKLQVDPNLKYEEQKYVLSARLWTNGIDIYYPNSSFFYRLVDEEYLNEGKDHYDLLSGLFGVNNCYSTNFSSNYKYKLGKERPLWAWYDYIGYDYDSDSDFEV